MKYIFWLAVVLLGFISGCREPGGSVAASTVPCECKNRALTPAEVDSAAFLAEHAGDGALLSTRFKTLDDFKKVVKVEYNSYGNPGVKITHCSNGLQVVGELRPGVNQDDIMKAKEGGIWTRAAMIFQSPYAISTRADLERVYNLSRRFPRYFKEGDPGFFDLAEVMEKNINTHDLAILTLRDTSEKGYLNTFNHFFAQAFLASVFSEEFAGFVADLHERKNMPELISGKFTPEQLASETNNPVDNYVDMINNEWGQEFGKKLKVKYKISRETIWTPQLLTHYLNDLQNYFSRAFQIGFLPFQGDEPQVVQFSDKINLLLATGN